MQNLKGVGRNSNVFSKCKIKCNFRPYSCQKWSDFFCPGRFKTPNISGQLFPLDFMVKTFELNMYNTCTANVGIRQWTSERIGFEYWEKKKIVKSPSVMYFFPEDLRRTRCLHDMTIILLSFRCVCVRYFVEKRICFLRLRALDDLVRVGNKTSSLYLCPG